MNDHDRRQPDSIRSQTAAFRRGAIDLSWVISSLESLSHGLQEVPQDWAHRFWSKWGVLEQVYSLSVVREQSISATDQVEITQVVGDIDQMITTLLQASTSDE